MKTLYVTQSGSGSADGLSLANSWSVANLNTVGNWGVGVGKINEGDIVLINGTLTSPITIQGSGSIGNVITLLFATNAKYSAATWTVGGSSGLIVASSKSYITIDGGTNGVIEATDNGQFLTYQNNWNGINLTACSNFTIKNISFLNMYVRSYGDTHAYCNAVNLPNNGSNNVVDSCSVTYAFSLVIGYYQGTSGVNLTVTNSAASYCAEVLWLGDGSAGSTWNGITYSNNTYDHSEVWGDIGNTVHAEAIHLYATNGGGSSIGGISITNSTFGPYNSGVNQTSYIYLEGGVIGSPLIANCIFKYSSLAGQYPSNGGIYQKSAATANIYNNVFVGDGSGLGINASNSGNIVYNNIVYDIDQWILTSTATSDYNDIYGINNSSATEGAHSITTNPMLNGTYALNAGSPCIGTGTDLSGIFTTDKNGLTRTNPWDMGAFKYLAAMGGSTMSGNIRISGKATIR